MSWRICVLRDGPAQIRQGPARFEELGPVLVHIVHEKDAIAQTGKQSLHRTAIESRMRLGCRSFETFHHAHFVPLGLQPADKPCSGVGQSLVVEVDRILSGENQTQPIGTRLFQQSEQRFFEGGFATGGK